MPPQVLTKEMKDLAAQRDTAIKQKTKCEQAKAKLDTKKQQSEKEAKTLRQKLEALDDKLPDPKTKEKEYTKDEKTAVKKQKEYQKEIDGHEETIAEATEEIRKLDKMIGILKKSVDDHTEKLQKLVYAGAAAADKERRVQMFVDRLTLDVVLKNKALLKIYYKFAEKILIAESVDFVVLTTGLKCCAASTAKDIYEAYLAPDAPKGVNDNSPGVIPCRNMVAAVEKEYPKAERSKNKGKQEEYEQMLKAVFETMDFSKPRTGVFNQDLESRFYEFKQYAPLVECVRSIV